MILPITNTSDECSTNLAAFRAKRLQLRQLLCENVAACEQGQHHAPLLHSSRGQRSRQSFQLPLHAARGVEDEWTTAIRDQSNRTNRALEYILREMYNGEHPREVLSPIHSTIYAEDPASCASRRNVAQFQQIEMGNSDIANNGAQTTSHSWFNHLNMFRHCVGARNSQIPSKIEWMEEGKIEDNVCPICFEHKEPLIQFPHKKYPGGNVSDHRMCEECFAKNGNGACPMCRGEKGQENGLLVLRRMLWGYISSEPRGPC
mmetsp:Transcript_15999/g.46006  ORF Transcript_15999/g.46006 Transcript_15999/m.46006 type:complete len:260 (-) Transcript_15999:862-1641(-)